MMTSDKAKQPRDPGAFLVRFRNKRERDYIKKAAAKEQRELTEITGRKASVSQFVRKAALEKAKQINESR